MIPLFRPSVTPAEIEAVTEALKSCWWGLGPRTAAFEEAFGERLGTPNVVALNSCTSALQMLLRLFAIRPGDEVIVPTMTFVSTAHAVVYCGAVPVFADVDPVTLCITPEEIERLTTPKTRGVIAVHYGGRPPDNWSEIQDAAHPKWLFEDAAHACGARFDGEPVGTIADAAAFSFHAVKNLAAGDGGAVVLPFLDEFADSARRLRWLGIDKSTHDRTGAVGYSWDYNVSEIGYKCHMNDLTAALALVQLERLGTMNERRRLIAKRYTEALADVDEVTTPPGDTETVKSSWHLYWIRAKDRNGLAAHLKKRGICTGVHYRPIHLYPCYGAKAPILPVAEEAFREILSLPMYPGLGGCDLADVVEGVKSFYA